MENSLEGLNSRFELVGGNNHWTWREINRDDLTWGTERKIKGEEWEEPQGNVGHH